MKLSTALRLGRVSNLPTTWTNVAAGLALAGGEPPPTLALGLCLAASALYVGGMYLNDAFDREYDARERPERPIPAGEVRASTVFALGFGLLGAGVGIVAALAFGSDHGAGTAPVLSALALASVIVFYDAYHKQNPLSPVVMAVNRALVYVVAAQSMRSGLDATLGWGCACIFCYLVGLTYAAKQENLREPRGSWPLLFLAVPFGFVPAFSNVAGIACYALLAVWTGYNLTFLLDRRRRDVKRAVSQLIAGICLLDAMVVASRGQALLASACVLGLGLTLLAQRRVPGT
ncbi:MAG: UbiA family prenyltransferase [Polyangiales bacterium]